MGVVRLIRLEVLAGAFWILAAGCDTPQTNVVLDNQYPPSQANALVVYRAFWQAVSFIGPIPPGSSSDPQSTAAASENTAYVVLAPGWNPAADGGPSTPASFIVLRSRNGFAVHLDTTLHVPIDDAAFAGNCAAGSFLTQEQADFITERVFPIDFAGLRYDASTCATTGVASGGGH